MAKDRYFPWNENERAAWLNNFVPKFAAYAASLGFSPTDVTSVNNDAAMYTYLINMVEAFTTSKEHRVNYKKLINNGPIGKTAGPMPGNLILPTAPATVAPGIIQRITNLVQRIKRSPTYTDAIGKDLGIIGAEQVKDLNTLQPVIKLVRRIGKVEVQWTKGGADALYIEVDRGAGEWKFLAVDMMPHFTDNNAITAPAVWKYRAAYMVNDARVGQWSAEVSISVG